MKALLATLALYAIVIAAAYYGATRPDTCKDRRPFEVGGPTLGVKGTYCAERRSGES